MLLDAPRCSYPAVLVWCMNSVITPLGATMHTDCFENNVCRSKCLGAETCKICRLRGAFPGARDAKQPLGFSSNHCNVFSSSGQLITKPSSQQLFCQTVAGLIQEYPWAQAFAKDRPRVIKWNYTVTHCMMLTTRDRLKGEP